MLVIPRSLRNGSIALLSAIFLAYAFVAYHRSHGGFSAREAPSTLEAWIARNVRLLSMPHSARQMVNPIKSTTLGIAEARDHFADHCAFCHANDGSGRTALNEGLYPRAPDLRLAGTQELSDGELLFVIRNGVRFTGMPGFGGDDQENWKLVAFIRHLPKLSQEEIGLMTEVNGLNGN